EQLTKFGTKFLQEIYVLFTAADFRADYLINRLNKAYSYFYPKLDELAYDTLFVLEQSKKKKGFVLFSEQLSIFEEEHIKIILKLIKTHKMIQLFKDGNDFNKKEINGHEVTAYRLNHLTAIKEILSTQILDIDTVETDDLKEIPKTPKISTIDKTFELWQRKKTIVEIAEERKLSVQTIYQHIGKLIAQQKIDITEVIPQKKLRILKQLFENYDGQTLTGIKAEAGDNVTWEELRVFKNSLGN